VRDFDDGGDLVLRSTDLQVDVLLEQALRLHRGEPPIHHRPSQGPLIQAPPAARRGRDGRDDVLEIHRGERVRRHVTVHPGVGEVE
jgi:hypothetical protein